MNECTSQDLKFNGDGQKSHQNLEFFSHSLSYDFKCLNCKSLLYQQVILDFLELFEDDKLVCPFCMSLKVEEVNQ